MLAKLAAWKMNAHSVALVTGNTIHLHNITKPAFEQNEKFVKHELKHVEQYQRLGFIPFLWMYLWYSLKYGYFNNPFEIEAREAEKR
jgi:hypothetical protein